MAFVDKLQTEHKDQSTSKQGPWRKMLSSKDINFVGYMYKNFEVVNDHEVPGIEHEYSGPGPEGRREGGRSRGGWDSRLRETKMLSSKDINFIGYMYKNFEVVNDHEVPGIGRPKRNSPPLRSLVNHAEHEYSGPGPEGRRVGWRSRGGWDSRLRETKVA
ncbi:hypothetical protein H6P81_012807 [Aristolochia fimbriata]|uniref:Uncharacterized protein n=1 Tax=Aristolochia fimbriata TaxID=158543 RepID=A0AAV7EEF2_ARIFI|nr:hypothetical protein H6P81_012807 [Aristolochia fimbriata]